MSCFSVNHPIVWIYTPHIVDATLTNVLIQVPKSLASHNWAASALSLVSASGEHTLPNWRYFTYFYIFVCNCLQIVTSCCCWTLVLVQLKILKVWGKSYNVATISFPAPASLMRLLKSSVVSGFPSARALSAHSRA